MHTGCIERTAQAQAQAQAPSTKHSINKVLVINVQGTAKSTSFFFFSFLFFLVLERIARQKDKLHRLSGNSLRQPFNSRTKPQNYLASKSEKEKKRLINSRYVHTYPRSYHITLSVLRSSIRSYFIIRNSEHKHSPFSTTSLYCMICHQTLAH